MLFFVTRGRFPEQEAGVYIWKLKMALRPKLCTHGTPDSREKERERGRAQVLCGLVFMYRRFWISILFSFHFQGLKENPSCCQKRAVIKALESQP